MNGFRDYLRGICVLISDAACCVLVLGLFPVVPSISYVKIPVALWCGVLGVQLLVNLILTWRESSMNGYILWNLFAAAAGGFLVGRGSFCPEINGEFVALTVTAAVLTALHGAYLGYKLPGANLIVGYVDVIFVLLAFYLYAAYSAEMSMETGFVSLSCAAILLDLLAVNRIRTNEENVNIIRGAGAGSGLMLALIVIAIFGLTGAVVGFASGQIHDAVDLFLWFCTIIYKAVSVVFSIVGTALAWIVMLLIYFLPATPEKARENARAMVQENVEEIVDATGLALPIWFWQLLGIVLCAAFLLFVLHVYKGVRIGRKRMPGKKKKVVRKSFLFSEIAGILKGFRERIRFEIRYRSARRTPAGLLVYADRLGRHVHYKEDGEKRTLGRRKEESPGEYMRRLSSFAKQRGQAVGEAAELLTLARSFDETFYRGAAVTFTKEECARYESALQNLRGMLKS